MIYEDRRVGNTVLNPLDAREGEGGVKPKRIESESKYMEKRRLIAP